MAVRQEPKAYRNSKERGKDEPARTGQVDFLPILHNDHERDGDGRQHRERSSDLHWNAEGEERDCNQRFPKTECGTDQCCDEQNEQNQQSDSVDCISPSISDSTAELWQ